jgi:hypothetical protein
VVAAASADNPSEAQWSGLLRGSDRLDAEEPAQRQSPTGMPRAAWWSNLEDVVVAPSDDNRPNQSHKH